MHKQVEYSLIQTLRLLKQILLYLGRLFQEENFRYLELFHQLELLPRTHDSWSHRESTVDLFRRTSSLSNR